MPKSITIQGLTFEVATPYEAGHQITEAEAKALNQTRAENIRNNFASKVKAAKEEHGESLPDGVVDALTSEVYAYDQNYEFTLANAGGGARTMDPVEREATNIARQAIRAKAKSEGRRILKAGAPAEKETDITKDRFDDLVAEVAARENVLKAAKKAVAEREKGAGDISL